MRFAHQLDRWLSRLLPGLGPAAQPALATALQALLVGYSGSLTALARQTDRAGSAKTKRQWLSRWLGRPDWEPEVIYAALTRQARRLVGRRGTASLLVDFTDLGTAWRTLQVSLAFRGRAVVLYRSVVAYTAPEIGQPLQVQAACAWLWEQLPGPLDRYVLVMDRGFPSHLLVKELTASGWRFVLRAQGEWKVTHPRYTGQLKHAPQQTRLVGPTPRCLAGATLGSRRKGRAFWSAANVVLYQRAGAAGPWYLLTSEAVASRAVALYQSRAGIEAEFRDLKGPLGLERLASWQDRGRVARFLALVALYEWRLVQLWLKHRLQQWAPFFRVGGRLSWIEITRLWIQHQCRLALHPALPCL